MLFTSHFVRHFVIKRGELVTASRGARWLSLRLTGVIRRRDMWRAGRCLIGIAAGEIKRYWSGAGRVTGESKTRGVFINY